jgi:DEAD/DEAH box helicase domain-containing protein
MDVRGLIQELTSDPQYEGQATHIRALEPRTAQYAQVAQELPESLWALLHRQNIHQLYSHQASALDEIAAGEDVVIVTSTASGKTLCYNLAVARALLKDPAARALYLFPTKALAQDQLGTLQGWAKEPELADRLTCGAYDGDTPTHARANIRHKAAVILTNPDMLHVGILPYHGKWHEFLRNLKYIVLDELHTYRGIFGSHVAGVIRRLLRLCEHYGSHPQIICCSATIANPLDLAQRLTGRDMTLIANDGSPRGRKFFLLWNPPFLGVGDLTRRSANVEAVKLLTELVRRRAQTIVFAKARIVAELVYRYAVEQLADDADLARRIRPYRGGYLPNERREIEQQLFAGELLAVSSTNALELGIDVGSMDASILVGFPGTICSTWQQAGRAGRSNQESLALLIAYNEPIDQYLMRHPDYLLGASCEHGVIDPANPYILAGQVACACFEKPLTDDDRRYFGPMAAEVAKVLAEEGEVKALDGRYYWRSTEFPARSVNLRTISDDTVTITNLADGATLGNVDSISAPELVYPGAVYLHEGRSFLVRSLDNDAKVAAVEPSEVDYYTQPVLASSCRLGQRSDGRDYLGADLWYGAADVTWQTTAYRKFRYYTMEMIGQDLLDLPAQTLATMAMAWPLPKAMLADLRAAGHNPIEALMGVRNLQLAALPALAMCDRRDISGLVDSSNLGQPAIIIYDRYPGGLGFAEMGFQRMDEWLGLAERIVAECPCRGGCPSCVGLANLRPPLHQDPDLGMGYPVPNKDAAVLLLRLLAAEGKATR